MLEHDGEFVVQVEPENLSFTMNKGENGPHEMTFEISCGNEGVDFTRIVPYDTDFRLVRDNAVIMAGMITSTNFESDNDWFNVAGKSWLHYLERRHFPFDPLHPNQYRIGAPPRGLAMQVRLSEVSDILDAVFQKIVEQPWSLDFTWELVNPAAKTAFRIDLGDTESILSKVTGLAQQYPGIFDFWMDNNKVFKMIAPRKYPIEVVADPLQAAWYFEDSDDGLVSLKHTNNGPLGTHFLGTGAGKDVRLGLALDSPMNQRRFRRLDHSQDFGDIANRGRVNSLTTGYFGTTLHPQLEITAEIIPDLVRDFWRTITPGDAIWINGHLPQRHINSAHEVVSIEAQVTTEANEIVTLNLNQVYPYPDETTLPPEPDPDAVLNKPPKYRPSDEALWVVG